MPAGASLPTLTTGVLPTVSRMFANLAMSSPVAEGQKNPDQVIYCLDAALGPEMAGHYLLDPRHDQLREAFQFWPSGLERLAALRIHAERHDPRSEEHGEEAPAPVLIVRIDGGEEGALA